MKENIYLILFLAMTVFISCEDKEDYGAPVISSVKQSVKVTEEVDGNPVDVMRDQDIEQGALGDWIFIDGSNFYQVKEIIFNDVSVDMSTVYVSPNRISVCVPRYAPKEITNKITVITDYGIAVKDFPIDIPPLIVSGLLNEYVKPGSTGYITGENFDIYQLDSVKGAWLEIDGEKLGVTIVNSKQLSFKVPMNIKPGADIHLYRKDKEEQIVVDKKVPGYYRDDRYIFLDFNVKKGHWSMEVTDGLGQIGYPDSISGKYCVFKGDYPAYFWGGSWSAYDNLPLKDYFRVKDITPLLGDVSEIQMVMEVNVPKDWANVPLRISWEGFNYFWKPHTGVAFKTDGWMTIRIPFKELKDQDGKGKSMGEVTEQFLTKWFNRDFMIFGAAQNDLFICIDNVRLAPVN